MDIRKYKNSGLKEMKYYGSGTTRKAAEMLKFPRKEERKNEWKEGGKKGKRRERNEEGQEKG